MKAKHLITLIIAALLSGCDKPNPINTPLPPEMYTLRINTVSEDAYNRPLPDRTDVYIYPSTTSISFDTIEFKSNLYHNPYTLQHKATPPDTVRLSRQAKSHIIMLEKGEYKAVVKYLAYYWYDDTCAYRYSVSLFDISSDTIINDTLFHRDWEKYKQLK